MMEISGHKYKYKYKYKYRKNIPQKLWNGVVPLHPLPPNEKGPFWEGLPQALTYDC